MMTNKEAYNIVSEFCFAGYEDNKKPTAKLFNAIRELACEAHENAELRDYKARLEKENTKLKAEIEQFADELISVRIENELLRKKNELTNYYFEQYAAAIDEIEQLKRLSDQQSELNIEQFKQIDNQYQEIEQLKSELEQSVKLPCKCENCKYADFMGVGAERFYCMEHHRYMVVGGYCSFGKSEVGK